MSDSRRPIVFISYSHDSDTHRERVLGLSERLRDDGYETRLDQHEMGTPKGGWPRWMMDGLDEASHVLVVSTATYHRRFRGHEEPDRGKGVDWEGALITNEIYHAKSQTVKFVPVLFEPSDEQFIPEPLRGHTHYTLNLQASYDALCDFLDGVAGVEPRPVGQRKPRERRRGTALTFADTPPQNAAATKPNNLPFVSLAGLFKGRDDTLLELRRRLQAAPIRFPEDSKENPIREHRRVAVFSGGIEFHSSFDCQAVDSKRCELD